MRCALGHFLDYVEHERKKATTQQRKSLYGGIEGNLNEDEKK